MKPLFSSERHAGAFAVALFGLCVFQSVSLLQVSADAQTAAIIPPEVREDLEHGSATSAEEEIGRDVRTDRRDRRLRIKQEAARKMRKAEQDVTTGEINACGRLEMLMKELKCDEQ